MQNNMQITAKWSRLKPKVEFQYGGRLFFFKNGISYISAVNSDMSVTSTNTKPEVVFSGRDRHL